MKFLSLSFLFLLPLLMIAQERDASELEVIKVIDYLFDGMRTGDSSMVHAAFTDDATMESVFYDKEGKSRKHTGSLQKFLESVGTPHDEVFDEKIWSYDVRIDGNLASAWTDYSFYLGEKMLHCGVNAFHLFKSDKGWKISHITDTRRRKNCQTEDRNLSQEIHDFMNQWHKAAATADEDLFFGSMTIDGIYIGTDASERWLRDEMKEWAKKYFERDTAWDFTTTERDVYWSKDEQTAWFEESLDTWMGICRASGVLIMTEEGWKITHYHLSVTVPNELVQDFIKLVNEKEQKD